MLSRPCLGDDPGLAEPFGENPLRERIIDLMRSGMKKIFAFEKNAPASEMGRKILGFI